MEWRTHDFIKIVYALQGSGEMHIGTEKHTFLPKDLLIVPAGRRNRVVDATDQPSSLYVLCVAPSLFSFDTNILRNIAPKRIRPSSYLSDRVAALLRQLLFQQSHAGQQASLAMAAATFELFQMLMQPASTRASERPVNGWKEEMLRYVEYLDTHFFEVSDIEGEARKLGVSRRTFTQQFRQVTGMSWLKYVRSKAIDHAARLLIETSAPISSVAFECGFGDLSTFYRKFKSQVGVTPAAWRRRG